jgi:hypothetical protein
MKYTLLFAICILLIGIIINIKDSFAHEINETINEDSNFIYYIEVKYNEIHGNGHGLYSSDSIHVEDTLPEGLTFVEFIPFKNQNTCYNVLGSPSYNEQTRKIICDLNYMYSGCTFKLGVIVKTGTTNLRTDYYNTAKTNYRNKEYYSNTAHTYIGNENASLHSVNYSFAGISNDLLNSVIPEKSYSEGQEVTLEEPEEVFGYNFIGWSSNDVTITDGRFIMPNKNVTIVGTYEFLNIPKHKVTFRIEGDGPKSFVLPKEREYYYNDKVKLVTIISGDAFSHIFDDEYMLFDVKYSDNVVDYNYKGFSMPDSDVTISLIFEKVPYAIGYNFIGKIIPIDAELPKSTINYIDHILDDEYYYRLHVLENYDHSYLLYFSQGNNINNNPSNTDNSVLYGMSLHFYGDKVNLIKDYKSTTCINLETNTNVKCRFLGWLYNDEFNMPSRHLNIYGTWMEITGTFEPEIKVEVTNKKDFYKKGETVQFKTTITNTSDVDIKDLVVENKFKDQVFVENDKYTVNDDLITIKEIKANESINLYSTYVVGENTNREFTNELEIISASAEGGYYLENSDYTASTNFETRKTGDNTPVDNTNNTENETISTETNSTPSNETHVPKTSDNAYIYILLLVGSLILIVAIIIVFIKNKKDK